ncbi:hypothetical protein H8F25_06155 [Synechococcus sp. CBW1004]|nr:hypothetical protein H8F25_06155 [Synechococcus sp. CBW1004]
MSRILRRDVIDLLLSIDSVDLFGRSTNPIANKQDALIPYAFSIAMENTSSPLYFTEKLIDCILAGAIPIYHGTREVEQYFDARGIIFFDTIDELLAVLSTISLEKYRNMRKYALANYQIAINNMLCDYHGYLHRACSIISASSAIKISNPFKYSNSLLSRVFSKARFIREPLKNPIESVQFQ